MKRVLDEDKSSIIIKLPSTGRLPLDIILTNNYGTRREAHDAGHKTFFTGRKCIRGHLSDRYVSTGGCVECLSENAKSTVLPTVRTVPSAANIPACLGPGKVTRDHCWRCPKYAEGCLGFAASTKLRRARLAFANHETVRRVDAIAAGTVVYIPEEACTACGIRSWRHVQSNACAECEWREWQAKTGAPEPAPVPRKPISAEGLAAMNKSVKGGIENLTKEEIDRRARAHNEQIARDQWEAECRLMNSSR